MAAPENIAGSRVTVIGMARSGVAAAELVKVRGGSPFVSDGAPAESLASAIARLDGSGIAHESGGHSGRALDADFVVVSPGVPPRAKVLANTRGAGLNTYSELELASWVCRAPIVAVTGTNGKTTTTALCGAMLRSAGIPNQVCGNIGVPLSAVVDELSADAVAVVEVSSYQLHGIDSFRPRVAVVTNLQPDHLDWHGSLDAYYAAKWRVAENQTEADTLVYNADDPAIDAAAMPGSGRRLGFSIGPRRDGLGAFVADGWLCVLRGMAGRSGEAGTLGTVSPEPPVGGGPEGDVARILPVSDVGVPGRHNLANAAAAALAVSRLGVPPSAIAEALRGFEGVEHRLEPVGEVAGVSFVNDSKATNVDSVCVALAALDKPVVLIMGGRDKGSPYEPVARAASRKVRRFVLIGEAADRIESELRDASIDPTAISRAATLDAAVRLAWAGAEPGEVVLLSPACSSFDMFDDFEDRGRAFKRAVAELQAEQPTTL